MTRRPKIPCPNCIHGVKRCDRHQRPSNPHAPTRLRLASEKAAEPEANKPESRNKRRKRKRAQKQRAKCATDPSNDSTTNHVAGPPSDDSDDDDTHPPPAKRIRLGQQAGPAKGKATPTDSGAQKQPSKLEAVEDSSVNSSKDSSNSSSEDSSNNSSNDSVAAVSSDDSDDDTHSPSAKRARLGQEAGPAMEKATPGQDYIPASAPNSRYNLLLNTIKKRLAELQDLVDIVLEQSATTHSTAVQSSVESEKAKRKRERFEKKERKRERREKKERKRERREQKERDKKVAEGRVEEAVADSSDDDSSDSENESSTTNRGHDKLYILTKSSKSPKKHRHSS
jgi:hypothetical protein